MVGVEGKDWEDVVLQASSTFWKFIEERRKEPHDHVPRLLRFILSSFAFIL